VMYAALAAVVCAVLAWDFGRRWLALRGVDVRDQLGSLRKDLTMLRDHVHGEIVDVRQAYRLNRSVTDERLKKIESAAPGEVGDLAKYDAALVNLGKQMQELYVTVKTKTASKEDLEASEKKLRTLLSGTVASGRR
jgi:hypothetical protein